MPQKTTNSNQPIFKDREGGLSVSAWQYSATIQKRKPDDPQDIKGNWHTEVELKPLNKKQCQRLGEMLLEAAKHMSERDFTKPYKGKAKVSNDDSDE